MAELDPMRHHRDHDHLHGAFGNDKFGAIAERVAKFLGTPKFICIQTFIVLCWVALNVTAVVHHWDPYPFILLNLAFSTQSAYAAPMILLAQTRQSDRDKAQGEAVAKHTQEEADRQIDMLGKLELILQHDDELTQLIHDHLIGRADGRPGSDQGLDSIADSSELPPGSLNLRRVPGFDQPADVPGDPEAPHPV